MTERTGRSEGRLSLNSFKADLVGVQRLYDAFMPYVREMQASEIWLNHGVVLHVEFTEPIVARVDSMYEVEPEKTLTDIDADSFAFFWPEDDVGDGFVVLELYDVVEDEDTQIAVTVRIDQIADMEIVGQQVVPAPKVIDVLSGMVNMGEMYSAVIEACTGYDETSFMLREGYYFEVTFKEPVQIAYINARGDEPEVRWVSSFRFSDIEFSVLPGDEDMIYMGDQRDPDKMLHVKGIPRNLIDSLIMKEEQNE